MQASFDAMSPAADVFTPLWTIALEEQFYLVFPLMMLAAGPFVRLRTVVPYAVAGLLFSIATRYYILANQIPYPMVWMNTLAHLDPFILGILGAVIWHHHRERMLGLRLYLAEVVLALGAFWLVMSFPQIGTSHHTVWQVGVVAVGALLLIGAVVRSRYLGLAFGWRPIAWMGRISYGLYVYHILGRQVYQQVVAPSIPIGLLQGPVRWMVEFLLVLAVTTVFAAVSYYAFERHFLRFKERLAVIPSRPA
jgi:peptidoglycan/LPS O-acetylase OafA/YrhL